MRTRRIFSTAVVLVSLMAMPSLGCASLLPDAAAQKASTVFDSAVAVLSLLDSMVTEYLNLPDAIPLEQIKAVTDATYDLMLARSNLENATDSYRVGDYAKALRDVKLSVGFMRDCVGQLQSLGVDVETPDKMLKALEAAL